MVIDNSEEAMSKFDKDYAGCGRHYVTLDENDIEELKQGKLIAIPVNDEYSLFIEYEKKEQ